MRHRRFAFGAFGLVAVGFAATLGCAPGSDAGTPNPGSGGSRAATGGGGSANPDGGAGPGGGGSGVGGSVSPGSGGAGATASGGSGSGGIGSPTGGAVGSGGFGSGGSGTGSQGTGGRSVTGGAGGGGGTGGVGGGGRGGGAAAPGGSTGTGGAGGAAGAPVPLDAALLSRCTGTNPIRCTIPVPANGNYTVTVELGGAQASMSRVQVELFRIVVPQVSLPAGMFVQQTFNVNVRAEAHDGYSAPGMVLDLLIDGPAPALHGVGVAAASAIPTVFVAGDSTVCDWDPVATNIIDPIQRGWAQEFTQYLKVGIAVANYADSGETAGGFYSKFFTPAKNAMRAGDYLFIQFGHNDQKADADIAAYQANLMRYITDARAKSATPILFTPVGRKSATAANPGFAGLDQQARDLAAAQNVTLIDLTTLTINYYRTVANLDSLFATASEGTHFSETGATQVANLVAQALRAGTLSLKEFVK